MTKKHEPRHPTVRETDDQLAIVVGRETGLRIRPKEKVAIRTWVTERMQTLGVPDIRSYGLLLGQDDDAGSAERSRVIVRLTTDESCFFRGEDQIDLLANTLLPALITRKSRRKRLRIWSAGCGTCEDAYTVAILLHELGQRIAGGTIEILGSDINIAALDQAHAGVYDERSLRNVSTAIRDRWFEQLNAHWQIHPRARVAVVFRPVDLVRDRIPDPDAGLSDFDLILCRNVLRHFTDDAASAVTAGLANALAEGGYLITGPGELFGHKTAPLRIRLYPQSVVHQRSATAQDAAVTPAAIDDPMQAAWFAAERDRRTDATRLCYDVITASPKDASPYLLLAHLAQSRPDASEAKALLRRAVDVDPWSVPACIQLAQAYEQEGDRVAARGMFKAARSALARVPANAAVPPYHTSSGAEVGAYVNRMLAGGSAL
jgi:chemotaxis protein methyltransferase CheR